VGILTVAFISIVIVIFITGYAFADISTFPDSPDSPICKRHLWLYLRANSLVLVLILAFLGHVAAWEVKRIAMERGNIKVSFNSLFLALYTNILCEIVAGVQDILYVYEYDE
jgi:hypothetical protein